MTDTKQLKGLIIMEILAIDTHSISRTKLLKKLWMHYTKAKEIDEIMSQFDRADMVRMEPGDGNDIIYTMPQQHVDELTRLFKNKQK